VIHGESPRRESSAAIMAYPFGKAAFPPLAFPQVTGLAAFALEVGFVQWIWKQLCFVPSTHGLMDTGDSFPRNPLLNLFPAQHQWSSASA